MTMRIPIKLVIEVDPDEWGSEYSLGDAEGRYRAKDVVEDVRRHVLNMVQQGLLNGDSAATAELAR